MEPVEINAGAYYLRQLRADDLIDDRPALVDAFADADLRRWVTRWRIDDLAMAGEYVARRADEWASGERCSFGHQAPLALTAETGQSDHQPTAALVRLQRTQTHH